MKPRDWKWDQLKKRLVLLDCPLPSRWNDLYAYRHAHRMWSREGKWTEDCEAMNSSDFKHYSIEGTHAYSILRRFLWKI